jgi:hypothetical protein
LAESTAVVNNKTLNTVDSGKKEKEKGKTRERDKLLYVYSHCLLLIG